MAKDISGLLSEVKTFLGTRSGYELQFETPQVVQAVLPAGVYEGEDPLKVQGIFFRGTYVATVDKEFLGFKVRDSDIPVGLAALVVNGEIVATGNEQSGVIESLQGVDGSRRLELEYGPRKLGVYLNGSRLSGR